MNQYITMHGQQNMK